MTAAGCATSLQEGAVSRARSMCIGGGQGGAGLFEIYS